MILIPPQQAVKQETPGWQRNFSRLSKVNFSGTMLDGFFSLPKRIFSLADVSFSLITSPGIEYGLQHSVRVNGIIFGIAKPQNNVY
jgi:hypothetical protein